MASVGGTEKKGANSPGLPYTKINKQAKSNKIIAKHIQVKMRADKV